MKFKEQNLKNDFSRDIYWTQIYVFSDDEKLVSRILICASYEFFCNLLKKTTFNENELENWKKEIVKKWVDKGDNLLDKDIHYDVYSTTEEGEDNGLNFLKSLEI